MVVAICGWGVDYENFDALVHFFDCLYAKGWTTYLYAPMADWLYTHFGYRPPSAELFYDAKQLPDSLDFFVSVGGDGTYLDTAQYSIGRNVPVLGINFGHMGFLASATSTAVGDVAEALEAGEYCVEQRVTARVDVVAEHANSSYYALNDITIQKNGKSMLIINAHIDGNFLCTYWCDGVIVSTPTGSTAYSLSVGGPIILPDAKTLLLSPIAPHNLGIRPLVLPDTAEIHLRVTSRDPEMMLSVDAQEIRLQGTQDFTITRGDYTVGLVRLKGDTFYSSLRGKLHWGMDVRN